MPVLIIGMAGAMTMCIRRSNGDAHRLLFVRPYSENPAMFNISLRDSSQKHSAPHTHPRPGILRLALKGLHELHEGGYMIVALAILYGVEQLFFLDVSHHPVLTWAVIFYGLTSCLYLLREIIGGFYSVEGRIAQVAEKFIK